MKDEAEPIEERLDDRRDLARLAAATHGKVTLTQKEDLTLDVTERLQVVKELACGIVGEAALARTADECGDPLHLARASLSLCLRLYPTLPVAMNSAWRQHDLFTQRVHRSNGRLLLRQMDELPGA